MNLLDPAYYFGHRHYKLEKLKRFLKDNGFKIIKSTIKGGFWFSFYLIWLYITKRITGNFYQETCFWKKRSRRVYKQ